MNTESKKQQRQQEKFNEQINEYLNRIVEAYQEKFTDPASTDLEITEFGILLNNRWRTFCHMRKLKKVAYDFVTDYIKAYNESYAFQKNGMLPDPQIEEVEDK